ncbi:BQ2448_6775 [Microbotryum intermedium]|uniref:BQ2448_6775 protein n=1 Tax=Microbotryum intermedium TaxID=269621 RepID=A0A238FQR7_9BASI|nr:BQ2448_6775 [Microbotryum intermedium]
MGRVTNYSLYSIPTAYLLAFVPYIYLEASMTKAVGQWGNVSSRVNVDKASARLSEQMLAKFKRGALPRRSYERPRIPTPLWPRDRKFSSSKPRCSYLLAANLTRVPVESINNVAFLYLITRFLYNPTYVYGTSAKIALLRSLLWGTGQIASLWLLKRSADRLAKESHRLK